MVNVLICLEYSEKIKSVTYTSKRQPMKPLLIIAAFLITAIDLKAQDKKKIQLDSLKKVLGIADSIQIIKTDPGKRTAVFIDYNTKSKYHGRLVNKLFSAFDQAYYKETYKNQLEANGKPKFSPLPVELKKKWIRLYKYKGGFYIYSDCGFQMVYETTDSTFVSYPPEGVEPAMITAFEKQNEINTIKTVNGNVTFSTVNAAKTIYLVKQGTDCSYYTPVDKINDFKIIVFQCTGANKDIISFDKVECK
jgi:hypothetical protein